MKSIAAVVAPCASRKRTLPGTRLMASNLAVGAQNFVARQWLDRLKAAEPTWAAEDLYTGASFRLALTVARSSDAPMFVVSAGLGLVAGQTRVPGYDLTLDSRDDQSVGKRVRGGFNRDQWWESVASGPFATDWGEVFERDGLVLMALSQGYAQLISSDLRALNPAQQQRLRLFGLGIQKAVPAVLLEQVMPYDDRLDAIRPGTKTNFAARAMEHFWRAAPLEGTGRDHAFVERSLAEHEPPMVVHRPRLDDEQVIKRIGQHLRTTSGIQRILRRLRDEDRVACEQRRFTRLYHVAVERTTRRKTAQRSA